MAYYDIVVCKAQKRLESLGNPRRIFNHLGRNARQLGYKRIDPIYRIYKGTKRISDHDCSVVKSWPPAPFTYKYHVNWEGGLRDGPQAWLKRSSEHRLTFTACVSPQSRWLRPPHWSPRDLQICHARDKNDYICYVVTCCKVWGRHTCREMITYSDALWEAIHNSLLPDIKRKKVSGREMSNIQPTSPGVHLLNWCLQMPDTHFNTLNINNLEI